MFIIRYAHNKPLSYIRVRESFDNSEIICFSNKFSRNYLLLK